MSLPKHQTNSINQQGSAVMEFILWSTFYLGLLTIIIHAFNRLHHQAAQHCLSPAPQIRGTYE